MAGGRPHATAVQEQHTGNRQGSQTGRRSSAGNAGNWSTQALCEQDLALESDVETQRRAGARSLPGAD
jgi:hypothetical protein